MRGQSTRYGFVSCERVRRCAAGARLARQHASAVDPVQGEPDFEPRAATRRIDISEIGFWHRFVFRHEQAP